MVVETEVIDGSGAAAVLQAKPLETCALPCVRVVALVVDVLVEWRFLVVWVCVVVFVQGAAEEVLREATR